jgi:hypothetical protein
VGGDATPKTAVYEPGPWRSFRVHRRPCSHVCSLPRFKSGVPPTTDGRAKARVFAPFKTESFLSFPRRANDVGDMFFSRITPKHLACFHFIGFAPIEDPD